MTPAMLDRARQLATKQGVRNVDWHRGDVYLLPYAADTFTIVVTRYSFHHLLDPGSGAAGDSQSVRRKGSHRRRRCLCA